MASASVSAQAAGLAQSCSQLRWPFEIHRLPPHRSIERRRPVAAPAPGTPCAGRARPPTARRARGSRRRPRRAPRPTGGRAVEQASSSATTSAATGDPLGTNAGRNGLARAVPYAGRRRCAVAEAGRSRGRARPLPAAATATAPPTRSHRRRRPPERAPAHRAAPACWASGPRRGCRPRRTSGRSQRGASWRGALSRRAAIASNTSAGFVAGERPRPYSASYRATQKLN